MKRQITIGTKITLVTGGLCAAIILIGAGFHIQSRQPQPVHLADYQRSTAGTSGAHRG
jgi:hypothetical protein